MSDNVDENVKRSSDVDSYNWHWRNICLFWAVK